MYLGTTDEVTTCDCCGKSSLKSTVAIQTDDAVVYFGVVCAARKIGTDAKTVRTEAKRADDAKEAARRAAADAARRIEFARDQARLDARYPALRGERFRQMQALRDEGLNALEWLRAA